MIALVRVSSKEYISNPPMGLLYVGDALKKSGYEVEIFHFTPEEIDHYSKLIAKKDPLYVGISVFTGGDIGGAVDFSKELKKHYQGVILWGGVHPSLLPQQTLSEEYIDAIVCGEGEIPMVEFADALEHKKDMKNIRGIGFKKDGKQIINPQRPLMTSQEMDQYRLDWSLVDVNKYIYHYFDIGKVVSFVTSRGCPYQCRFCYNVVFNEQKWRPHSINYVVENINALKEQYDIEGIWYKDDNYLVNRTRSIEIANKVKLPYFIEASINLIDPPFAKKLNETNCREIGVGFESGNNRVLKDVIKKPFNREQILDGVKLLSQYKDIKIGGFFIFGMPGETREDFNQTIDMYQKLLEINPNVNISGGNFLPYPGAELYHEAIKAGFVPPTTTEGWKALDRWKDDMEITWVDWLTSKEVVKIRKTIQILTSLSRYDIPILKNWIMYRLSEGNYTMPIDLWLLRKLRIKYMQGNEKQISTKVVRAMVNTVTGQNRKYYWN